MVGPCLEEEGRLVAWALMDDHTQVALVVSHPSVPALAWDRACHHALVLGPQVRLGCSMHQLQERSLQAWVAGHLQGHWMVVALNGVDLLVRSCLSPAHLRVCTLPGGRCTCRCMFRCMRWPMACVDIVLTMAYNCCS